MSLVRFQSITKNLGGIPVLDGVDFRVEEGEKVGLIGRNGTGKTTVFRLITQEMEPDGGVIERMRRARVACLAQLPRIDTNQTIFDTVISIFRDVIEMEEELAQLEEQIAAGDESLLDRYGSLQEEFTRRDGYGFRTTVKRVLHGLGFRPDDFDLHVQALSGGQRTRLMLALVLLEDADLLLLDEPENHLDIEASEWLEAFLKECPKAVVIISHDRRMLNSVVQRIVEVERGKLLHHTGNYDAYIKQKVLHREQQQKAFDLQQQAIEKEEKWIERFRYKNTKARQVQSRIKQLEKLERVEAPLPESNSARFSFGEVVRTGQVVLDAKNLSMAYGDLTLYENVSLHLTRGERVGIIGPNGSGKTTLLRHLVGKLPQPGGGAVDLGHKVSIAFYEQQHESLQGNHDVLEEIRRARPDMTPQQVRTFMGAFLFAGDDVFKPLRALSGGELSRVALAKLILSDANLLLLDEPTNHLDIASREALETALSAYPGNLLLVSHDRALIDRLVDRLIIIEDGRVDIHLGNYSHWRWKQGEDAAQQRAASGDALKIRRGKPDRTPTGRDARKRRKQLEELERNIESLEELIDAFDQRFLDLDPADYEAARALKEEHDGLKQDLQALYEEWEKLVEE